MEIGVDRGIARKVLKGWQCGDGGGGLIQTTIGDRVRIRRQQPNRQLCRLTSDGVRKPFATSTTCNNLLNLRKPLQSWQALDWEVPIKVCAVFPDCQRPKTNQVLASDEDTIKVAPKKDNKDKSNGGTIKLKKPPPKHKNPGNWREGNIIDGGLSCTNVTQEKALTYCRRQEKRHRYTFYEFCSSFSRASCKSLGR